MSNPVRFDIGARVTCRNDNPVGHLKRVVADPLARCLTHLVVGPVLSQDGDRLVPIGMAHMAGSVVVLSCDAAGFTRLGPAVETEFIAASLDESGYGPEETYLWPNYGLSAGGMGTPGFRLSARAFNGKVGHDILIDQVPSGDVELRRGSAIIAADGPIGRLHGLIIDQAGARITHLLLEHGHLWGHREVAIPLDCVMTMTGDIHLSITRDDVENLPAVAHAELIPQRSLNDQPSAG
jgi:hypothetical protein